MDILLIDDNQEEANLTLRTLKKLNPRTEVVYMNDGEDALKFILSLTTAEFPKVILLDLKMPRLDGIGILRELKSKVNFRAIPVVMLTSSREEADIVKTYSLGVNAYIVKPVDTEKFVAAVSEIGIFWLTLNTTINLPWNKNFAS